MRWSRFAEATWTRPAASPPTGWRTTAERCPVATSGRCCGWLAGPKRTVPPALVAGGKAGDTRGVREAYALAIRVGAAAIADDAGALARRTRLSLDEPDTDAVRPVAEDPLARFGLTEREREILLLLAAGRSNPQIAG